MKHHMQAITGTSNSVREAGWDFGAPVVALLFYISEHGGGREGGPFTRHPCRGTVDV